MPATPSGDQISRLLHVVVIEICQSVVSYKNELSISGAVFVSADGVEVCSVSFEDTIKRNCDASNETPLRGKDCGKDQLMSTSVVSNCSSFDDESGKDHSKLLTDEDGCQEKRGVSSASSVVDYVDDRRTEERKEISNSESPYRNVCSGIKRKKFLKEVKKHSIECDAHEAFTDRDDANHLKSSRGNMGEMVTDYWPWITPEILRASVLLYQLGELKKTADSEIWTHAGHENLFKRLHNDPNSVEREINIYDSKSDLMLSDKFQPLLKNSLSRNQCCVCHKDFTFATNLIRHQRKFHGKPLSQSRREGKDIVPNSKRTFGRRFPICRTFYDDFSTPGYNQDSSSAVGKCSHHSKWPFSSLRMDYSTNIIAGEIEHASSKASASMSIDLSKENCVDESSDVALNLDSVISIKPYDEELEVCDVDEQKGTSTKDDENCALLSSESVSTENSSENQVKAFEADSDNVSRDCFQFNTCSCWDKSGDSVTDNISVDVCDDNSEHYIEKHCSFGITDSGTSTIAAPTTIGQNDPLPEPAEADPNVDQEPQPTYEMVESLESPRHSNQLEPRMKRFECVLCSAGFSMSNNLQRHVRKAHGTAKEISTHPSATFEHVPEVLNCGSAQSKMTRSSRYRHICTSCGAAFTFRTNLTRHMKKIHGQIPFDASNGPKDNA